jgi:hypothetical protein
MDLRGSGVIITRKTGQLHTPSALSPVKNHPVSIAEEVDCDPEPSWHKGEEKDADYFWESKTDHSFNIPMCDICGTKCFYIFALVYATSFCPHLTDLMISC